MKNPYNNHGVGCTCANCNPEFELAKCYGVMQKGSGKYAEQAHQAMAESMASNALEQKHNQLVWSRGEGDRMSPQPTTEQIAAHLSAASSHGMAENHFRRAADAFNEDRPKAAEEHLELARKHAKDGLEKSKKLGVVKA